MRNEDALALHELRPATPASRQLLRTANELDVVLEPIHPGAEDPYLAPYFKVEVADLAAAEHLISRLQGNTAIEAAYVKPLEELP